jgi:hypothetical protein
MATTERKVHPVSVDYICDVCGKGYMRYSGVMLTVNPPLYPHKCDKCGQGMNLSEVYPHITYKDKP